MKVCPKCKKRRRASSFYVRADGSVHSWCKPCGRLISNERNKVYNKIYPKLRSSRNLKVLRIYGITLDNKAAMLKAQDGCCYICRRKLRASAKRSFCVDHDHDTGFVRGVLCWRCNQGISNFSDNVPSLERAIQYLERAWGAWEWLDESERSLWWPYRGRIFGKARAKRISKAKAKPTLPSEFQ